MPTRRILEVVVVAILAMKPIEGLGKIWAQKIFRTQPAGTVSHGTAEIASVIL